MLNEDTTSNENVISIGNITTGDTTVNEDIPPNQNTMSNGDTTSTRNITPNEGIYIKN